ncbi:hypothetical protein [Modicisalibacter tunisiensis]|uniref:Pyrrolo-quinoline quinone repeat domain-containing protein n=1 Tax=Modicisalibacter tunisiensis TaxID=390637 RepID=A0ABS7WUH0_9GAMM|nr:hypothetical protein [Modicisalibacter tunisiensis]KXS38011.1 MAG: quinoprotein glucose dehydrogenase [Halomonadaceae bacterium T82-2]MBZ9566251.1 hypothetical protein [Modicisalibacter tunisiensis]
MLTTRFALPRLVTATALTLSVVPLTASAQEQSTAQEQTTSQDQARTGTQASDSQEQTANPDQAATAQDQASGQASNAQADESVGPPIPLVPEKPTWDSFHGQLNAQKYSPLDQITADNVGDLEKVWEIRVSGLSG